MDPATLALLALGVQVLGIGVTGLGVLVTSAAAVYIARLNANVKTVKAEVAKVHQAVNSERTAMIAKLEELLGQNFTLKGAADERDRADHAAGEEK